MKVKTNEEVYDVYDVVDAFERAYPENVSIDSGDCYKQIAGYKGDEYSDGSFSVGHFWDCGNHGLLLITWREPDPSNPICRRLINWLDTPEYERPDFSTTFPEVEQMCCNL